MTQGHHSNSTIYLVLRAFDREERRVVLYVYSAFNEQVYQLFDDLDFQVSTVSELRSIARVIFLIYFKRHEL